jgi:choline dehydrogenase-like flavoprotein
MSNHARWGPAERRIFAAVVSGAMGVEAGEAVADAIAPFVAALSEADRRRLRFLLRAIEYGAPFVTGRLRRFTRLSAPEQASYLRRWAESGLQPLRQGAAALKALAAIAHYGLESSWPAIGYDGPWLGRRSVPVLPAPSPPISPTPATGTGIGPGITAARNAPGDLRVRAQACVIGLGAGGAAAFARLTERGVDVVAIEAGGAVAADEFSQRELEMLPLLYREAGLRATADKAIGILQGKGVGGSTLHNTGLVYAPPKGVIDRWRRDHGFHLDDAELDRRVAEVFETLHATSVPPEAINGANEALRRGAAALGWRYRVTLHNRATCSGCGYCMLGCAYNRKYNAALTYVPRGVAAGGRVLAAAAAVRIEGRAGARRVVCDLLDGAGRPTGRRAIVEAERVLVAAGALDSPALLRRSGLGTDRVGRGLRLHPAATVTAVFPERVEAWRGVPQAVLVEEFATFFETGRGGFLLIPNAATAPAMMAVLVPGLGRRHRAVMRDYPRLAAAAVLLHDEGEGRVTAGRGGRPVARYRPVAGDLAELLRGVEALARLYLAAGAETVHLPYVGTPPVRTEAELAAAIEAARSAPHRVALNSVHPQGSCPMGDDARSATTPECELRGTPGVYVCDASIFPTSIGVPPQATIMALATAIADRAADGIR